MSRRPAYSPVLYHMKSAIARLLTCFGAGAKSGKVKPRRHGFIMVSICGDYCIVLYSSIYIAPLNSHRQTEALLVRLTPKKRQVLRSDKDVERLDDRREAQAEGERRFQREGAITAKDLDMAMVVLVRGTKSSRLSKERRG